MRSHSEVLPYPVEYDHRIVDRITYYREQCRYDYLIHLEGLAEKTHKSESCNHSQNIVKQGNDGAKAELPALEPDQNIKEDGYQ